VAQNQVDKTTAPLFSQSKDLLHEFSQRPFEAKKMRTNMIRHAIAKLTLLAVFGAGLVISACAPKTAGVSGDEMSLGKADAKVTIVEYASVACPICARVNDKLMPELKKKYIDTGKVKYVYRPMLTGVPSIAATGHMLAECAGKDKYFTVIDTIMRAQPELYPTGEETDAYARPVLLRVAASAGIDEAAFDKCVSNPDSLKRMNDLNEKYLKEDQIEGTPTFFVNGKRMTGDVSDISTFDKVIEPQLK
jgi:protein-disulfide isomerase